MNASTLLSAVDRAVQDADGIALIMAVGLIGLAGLLVAIVIEWWMARGLRRQRRRREALNRYCASIDAHTPQLLERMARATGGRS